jgi:hypothetical protein
LSSVCLCGHPCCKASNRLGFESCYSQHGYYFVIRVLVTCWYTQLSCNIILLSLKKKVLYTIQTRHHRSGSWFCSQLADTWDDTTSCMECKCPRPLGDREPVRAGRIRRRIDDRWRILPCGRFADRSRIWGRPQSRSITAWDQCRQSATVGCRWCMHVSMAIFRFPNRGLPNYSHHGSDFIFIW